MTTITIDKPRIYVACLAAYNNGYLHGAWIDATKDAWAIWESVRAMLATSPIADAEEFAIHDYEGFGGVRLQEYTPIERVAALAAFIGDHGALGAAVLDYYSGDLDEAAAAIEDRYRGCYDSLAADVQERTEEAMTVPEPLRFYVDWEAMADDLRLSGDVFTIETAHSAVHVFTGY